MIYIVIENQGVDVDTTPYKNKEAAIDYVNCRIKKFNQENESNVSLIESYWEVAIADGVCSWEIQTKELK